MLVKFNPTIGNTDVNLIGYNFMRAIDAVITAAASSTPVVRPLTAANTYNNSLNIITSVISNTEAGGWTRSSSYNLVDASYSSSGMTGSTYLADYYNASGKSEYPYKKYTVLPQTSYSNYGGYPYIDVIYGIHTDTAYSAVAGYQRSQQVTSGVITEGGYYGTVNAGQSLIYPARNATQGTANVDSGEWIIAATQDYIILVNAAQSIVYAGIRTTNAWENSYSNNPPVVGWSSPTSFLNISSYYQTNNKFAWMLTQDGAGVARSTPARLYTTSPYTGYNFTANDSSTVLHGGGNVGVSSLQLVGNHKGGPLYVSRAVSGAMVSNPGYQQHPVTDSTGALVPCAIPIWTMTNHISSVTSYTYYNQGGRCLGIYKSLGGTDTWMNNFYTPGQIFVVDGDNYYPFLTGTDTLNRDIFLLRAY